MVTSVSPQTSIEANVILAATETGQALLYALPMPPAATTGGRFVLALWRRKVGSVERSSPPVPAQERECQPAGGGVGGRGAGHSEQLPHEC